MANELHLCLQNNPHPRSSDILNLERDMEALKQQSTCTPSRSGFIYEASTDDLVLELSSSPSPPASSSSSSQDRTCMAPTPTATPTPISSPSCSNYESSSHPDHPLPPPSSSSSSSPPSSPSSTKTVAQLVHHLVMCRGHGHDDHGHQEHGKVWHMVKACFKPKILSKNNEVNKVKGSRSNVVHKRNGSAQAREEDLKEAVRYCKTSWLSPS